MAEAPPLDQPISLQVMLDEAMKQVRRHFREIYPPVALPLAAVAGLVPLAQSAVFRGLPASPGRPDPVAMLSGTALSLAVTSVFLLLHSLAYGALLVAAVDVLSGRAVSMARCWLMVVRPRVFGTLLLSWLAFALGLVFCLLPGFYLGLLFCLIVPVMAEERRFGVSAMGRSAELVRYNPQRDFGADPRVKAFLIILVGTLLGYAVNLIVQLPLIVIMQVTMFRRMSGGERVDPTTLMADLTWLQVPTNMLGMLAQTAVSLYVSFGLALLFFDIRRRKEGMDLEAAIAGLVRSSPGADTPHGFPAPEPSRE